MNRWLVVDARTSDWSASFNGKLDLSLKRFNINYAIFVLLVWNLERERHCFVVVKSTIICLTLYPSHEQVLPRLSIF